MSLSEIESLSYFQVLSTRLTNQLLCLMCLS